MAASNRAPSKLCARSSLSHSYVSNLLCGSSVGNRCCSHFYVVGLWTKKHASQDYAVSRPALCSISHPEPSSQTSNGGYPSLPIMPSTAQPLFTHLSSRKR